MVWLAKLGKYGTLHAVGKYGVTFLLANGAFVTVKGF